MHFYNTRILRSLHNLQNGFTLIELMVTISILVVLSVIGQTVYSELMVRVRDAKRLSDSNAIQKALSIDYYKNQQKYTIPDSYWGHVNIDYATQFKPYFASEVPADPNPDPTIPESNYKLSLCRSNGSYPHDSESPNVNKYLLCVRLEKCSGKCNRSRFPADGETTGVNGPFSGHCSPASDGTSPSGSGWYCVRQ